MGNLPFGTQAFEFLKDAVIIINNTSTVLYINNAASDLYDVSKENAIGIPLTHLFMEEESSDYIKSPSDSSHSTTIGSRSTESYHVKRNGHRIRVYESIYDYVDYTGNSAGKIYLINAMTRKIEGSLDNRDYFFNTEYDVDFQELSKIIDSKALQSMMEDLYSVTKIGCAVIDLKGNILASAGWQDICSKFHRLNPQTLWNCLESDLLLTRGVARGEFRAYKCKNNLWDIVTPLIIGKRHVANVFSGQFFFDDEVVDRDLFAKQAENCGFDKEAYLAALDKVPIWNRKIIESLMQFYVKLSEMISKLSYSNLKFSKALSVQKDSEDKVRKSQHDLNHAQAVAKTGSWRLNIQKNELVWSDETHKMFGVPKGTSLTYESFLGFIHPEDKAIVDEQWKAALQGERYDVEHRIIVNDEIFWVRERAELEFDAEGNLVAGFGTIQDITEHKIDEQKLRKINRAIRAISNSNQVLMRATDEGAFLQQGCRIIVEDCGYALVCIGYAQDDEEKTVKPMAYAGIDKGYIDSLKITWADTERGQGPNSTAIRKKKIQVCNDMRKDPKCSQWNKEALDRGYLSSIVLPLIVENKAIGAINIFSKEINAFTDDEINLLSELANDFSHGIIVLRMRAANEQAKEALLYDKERIGLISDTASSLLSAADPQTIVKELCKKVMAFLKCDAFFNFLVDEEKQCLHLNAYAGVSAETAKTFEWLQFGEAVCGCAAQQGERIVCENTPDSNDHRTTLVRSFGIKAYAANPLFIGGKVMGTLSFGSKHKSSFNQDELSLMKIVASQVSVALQRKKDEELLKITLNRFYDSFANMHGSVLLISPDECVEFVNQSFCNYFNLAESPSELKGLNLEQILKKTKDSYIDPERETHRIREIINAGKAVIGEEIKFIGKRVSIRDFIPLKHEGKSLSSLWHYMDITSQKRAEETLVKSRDEWERTFNALPDLVAIVDQKHRILRVNKPMADRLGIKPEQCFGLQCFVCVHDTNKPPEFCPHTKTLMDGKKHFVEVHDEGLGGDFIVSTTPLTDANGNIFASIHIAREINDERICHKPADKKDKKAS